MEDLSKMELRHWANFDQTYLKDFFRDQPSTKLAELVAERDSAIAERDAARDEKKTAYSERDAALMQRDIAYADRDIAWAERDDALATLSEMQINADDENAATLMQLVHFAMNRPPLGSNLMCLPSNGREIQHSNLVATKSGAKKVMQQDKKLCKEFNVKQKSSGGAINTTKKGSKSLSRKRRNSPAQMETGARSEKVKQKDEFKCVAYGAPHNLSSFPVPFCSCTGNNQQCYRWGSGGWQSACCTNFVSLYPLPMNQAKPGSRLAGRKMSGGAFKKLLDRLGSIGIDITKPVDLKNHWAKHGTNRYVTIK